MIAVWPIPFLINMFTALKGSHFFYFLPQLLDEMSIDGMQTQNMSTINMINVLDFHKE